MTDRPSFVRNSAPPADDVTVEALQKKVAATRDLEMEIKNLEERLKEKKAELTKMLQDTLPALFAEARVKQVSIDAAGNSPAVSVEVKPFYSASLPVTMDADKREEGFKYLESQKAGALIKTSLIINFDRMDHALAKKLEKEFKRKEFRAWLGVEQLDYETKNTVNHQNLASWVRERHEAKKPVDLEKINGFVGQRATIKEVKVK